MLNRKGITPSLLKEDDSLSYSYPINSKYPRSVAFTSSHVGLMLAYSSSNRIFVLVEGKYVKAILKGHKYDICTLCFEVNGLHLISADVEGNVIFWHYQDSVWQITRRLSLKPAPTSFSWCAARQLVCFSSKNGLFVGNVSDFETTATKLSKSSKFCQFFNDGSVIASHSYKKALSVFSLINNKFVPQVFKFETDIVEFEFHPVEFMFIVITGNGNLRIYVRNYDKIFQCSATITVPIAGRFVRPPSIYKFKFQYSKVYSIVFVSKEGDLIEIQIDDKGKILTSKPGLLFKGLKNQLGLKGSGLRAAFHTNHGIEVVTVKNNGISVHSCFKSIMNNEENISMRSKTTTLFHRAKVVQSSFAPTSNNFFTLDEEGVLIFWPFVNPYESSKIISREANSAAWYDNRSLIVLCNDSLVSIDPLTEEKSNFEFPELSDSQSLFIKEKEVFVVCKNKIVTKTGEFQIDDFDRYSFSETFNNNFLFLTTKGDQVTAHILPSFQEIPVESRSGRIDSIGCICLSSFAVLSSPFIEIWNYINDKFVITDKFEFAKMNGMVCDSKHFGGRIFTFDDKRIYLIENGINPFLDQNDVTDIATSSNGDFVAISRSSMNFFPTWISKKVEIPSDIADEEFLTNRKDVYLNVERMTEDSRFLLTLSEIITHNFLASPSMIANPTESIRKTVDMTFVYLLEYSLINNLDNIQAVQVPAIPGQYAQSTGLQINEKVSKEIMKINKITKSIREDVDLFGLRYLTAVKTSNWPPAFIGLWLSFSISQSQIALSLKESITVSNLTKHFIAIGIHSQSLLEQLVKAAAARTWTESKKVDPVAVFYVAMSNINKIIRLYEISGDPQRAEFFRKDFTTPRNRKSALKNAYSSLSKQNFMMAAALFLIAGDLKSAVQITYEKLKDPILSFLIIRLVDKSVTSETMQWFLSYVQWSDQIIPVIIANLTQPEKIPEMIEPLLLDKQISANITSMGDRRISLYQIYHRLTNDSKLLPRIANNMLNDGFAPLANYIYKLPKTQQVQKITTEEARVEEESKSSDDEMSFGTDDDYKGEFDFGGGGGDWDDDSDDWGSSSSEDEDESEKSAEESENEKVAEEEEEKEEKTAKIEIFDQFLTAQIEQFSKYYANELEGNTNEIADFALHFGYSETGFKLFDEEGKNRIRKGLSRFIDYCGSMYMESARIPTTSKTILCLCRSLVTKITDEPFTFDYKSIIGLPKTGFSHSILYGSFAAAAWSFEPNFVDQLLTLAKPTGFNEDTIRNACSMLDADIESPRFPDTVPHLVVIFSGANILNATDIECARFAVMFLVLRRLVAVSKEFQSAERWHQHLMDKFSYYIKTLEMYQTAQNAPCVIEPMWPRREPANMPLLHLIKEEYELAKDFFAESHKNALSNLPSSLLFCRGNVMMQKPEYFITPFDKITSCCLNPLDKTQCAMSHGSQIAVIQFVNNDGSKLLFTSSMSSDVIQIKAHPEFQFFLVVSPYKVSLFDFDKQYNDQALCMFMIPTGEKVIAASFSPTGEKVAVCTEQSLCLFNFDLSNVKIRPYYVEQFRGKPGGIEWVSNANEIAVSFKYNIKIVNSLLRLNYSIKMEDKWGTVTAMRYNSVHSILVVGTKNGYAVVFDTNDNFELLCVIYYRDRIVSIACYQEVFVVATERGQVSIFSSTKLSKLESGSLPWSVKSVAIGNDFIVACGDNKSLAKWNVK